MGARANLWKVIAASSAGTLIEWYDFYIFGSLATILAGSFFPKDEPATALLATLATFATGFVVRPFGALVFGRLGDLVGRKRAFLSTLILMGLSTAVIGILPTYEQVGILAPIALLLLRMLQGLALGGEYGGAATYVAEHAPDGKRGFYTSFIQTTATLGFFLSLAVILACRLGFGEEASGVLLALLAAQSAAQAGDVLGTGDLIRISVFQNPDLGTEARVAGNGTIVFPLIGEVALGQRGPAAVVFPAAVQLGPNVVHCALSPYPRRRVLRDHFSNRLANSPQTHIQIDLRVCLRCGARLNIRGLINESHAIAEMLAALRPRAPPAPA